MKAYTARRPLAVVELYRLDGIAQLNYPAPMPTDPEAEHSARTRIIEAAARVAAASGAAHLTIDAVAAEAGLSKGGVLYHFPNKRALLGGMLERLIETSRERTARHAAGHGQHGVARIRGHILAERHTTHDERAISMALLAAAAEDPDLIAPARVHLAEAFAEACRGARDPELSAVLLLAAEGLRFLALLNLLPVDDEGRERIGARMLELADGAGG